MLEHSVIYTNINTIMLVILVVDVWLVLVIQVLFIKQYLYTSIIIIIRYEAKRSL